MPTSLLDQGLILRGPFEIAIDITNKCNYRCLHCYNASGENNTEGNELSDSEFLDLVDDICPMKPNNVCFCGGEPTLRLDLLCESAKRLRQSGIKSVSMVTNGSYIDDRVAHELYHSGISRVQVSLDGNEQSCSILRCNEKAYKNAKNALISFGKYNFDDINVAFCPTSFNIDELEDVCKTCIDAKVHTLRVQPLMHIGRATKNVDTIMPTGIQYINLIKKINQLNLTYFNRILITWGDPLDHIFRYRSLYHELSTYVTIKADGSIAPSPYLPISVGNVRKHRLSEYWRKGLPRVWGIDIVQQISNEILSIYDMAYTDSSSPKPWYDQDISIDIIDDEVLQ